MRVELRPIDPTIFVDNIWVDNVELRLVGQVAREGCGHTGPYPINLIQECTEQEIAAIRRAVAQRDGVELADVPEPGPPAPPLQE